jgi:hypothetical protein
VTSTGEQRATGEDAELAELLALVDESDSVELKLTIPGADQQATVEALELDPLDAQIRQVFFFDTPELDLNRAGLVARARRIQGRAHDSVVKLRPVVPGQVPAELRSTPAMKVEVDATPDDYVCSASLRGRVGKADVLDAVAGRTPLRKLFSKEQRSFFAAHAPKGLRLDDLAVLGPIFVLKLKTSPEGFDGKLTTEAWLYPDGTGVLELSTKCAPGEMFDIAFRARATLAQLGIPLSGEGQSKTKTALEFFSAQLR